jgi:hypothetical protein
MGKLFREHSYRDNARHRQNTAPIFTGYVLQYLSQIIIVARPVGRPVRRLFDPTLVALWAAQIAYITIPGLTQVK